MVGKGKQEEKVIPQCMKFPQFVDIFGNDGGEEELVRVKEVGMEVEIKVEGKM